MAQIIQAGDFATDGERRAFEELKALPDDWTVIANKILPTPGGKSFEIDFIVIGPHVIVAIDHKSRRGRIHGNDSIWVYEYGSSERSPLAKIDYVAKVLAGHVRAEVPGLKELREHIVFGCVLVSGAQERPRVKDSRAQDGITIEGAAVEHLKRLNAEGGSDQLRGVHDAIVRSLVDLSDRPQFPEKINSYTIEEVLQSQDGAYICRATHESGDQRMLTVYDVSGADDATRNFYLREYQVLHDLRGLNVVPEVFDTFSWSDDQFLVIPMAVPPGTSLGALPRPDDEPSAAREIAIAASAFRALARIHEAEVTHRAIGPGEVYVADGESSTEGTTRDSTVAFTGFHAAREGGLSTITSALDELRAQDPYAAPEVSLGFGFAEPQSDVYSLSLVFLERMSGVPVDQLTDGNGSLVMPTAEAWGYYDEDLVEILSGFFAETVSPGPAAPSAEAEDRPSASEAAAKLDAIVSATARVAPVAQSDLLDGEFEVQRVLGVGATARTFLVKHTETQGLFAAKQFLRPGVPRRDFEVLLGHFTPHIARVYETRDSDHDVHVLVEYVAGSSLTDEIASFRGDLQRTASLAGDLLSGLIVLESLEVLHRDIKPDNVILKEESQAGVLIDFGTATQVGADVGFSGTPIYVPPEAFRSGTPPESTDRYSVAVLLFNALTGELPFEDDAELFNRVPRESLDGIPEEQVPFLRCLLKAVAARAEDRFDNATSFREALRLSLRETRQAASDMELPDAINPWVNPLRGLYRHSRVGNADNRWGGDSEFMAATYVPTALDTVLTPTVIADAPSVVFLTGNPGDGKTAFLDQVRTHLLGLGAAENVADESGWEITYGERILRACYDASESHGELSADGQLMHKLRDLEGGPKPGSQLTVLIAINDGRLAEVLETHEQEFGWLTHAIAVSDERVLKVDLKQRTVVGLNRSVDRPSILRRNIEVLTAEEHWSVCETCSARAFCPIVGNVRALQGGALDRLEHLTALTVMQERRHITMRDLRSGLAFLLTGDTGCEDVHSNREAMVPSTALRYWNLIFARAGANDFVIDAFARLDPARFPQPEIERFLYFNRDRGGEDLRGLLFTDGNSPGPTDDPTAWIADNKRRLFFESFTADRGAEAPAIDWMELLPYRYAKEYLEALEGTRGAETLVRDLAEGLSRSDGLGLQLVRDHIALKVHRSDEQRLTVLKRFPVADFELKQATSLTVEHLEMMPRQLELIHLRSPARLIVSLDLFELAMRLRDGLDPTVPELGSILEDLRSFKNLVLLSDSEDFVIVEDERRAFELKRDGRRVVASLMES